MYLWRLPVWALLTMGGRLEKLGDYSRRLHLGRQECIVCIAPGRYQSQDLFIKVLWILCPNLTDAFLLVQALMGAYGRLSP